VIDSPLDPDLPTPDEDPDPQAPGIAIAAYRQALSDTQIALAAHPCRRSAWSAPTGPRQRAAPSVTLVR
jgi:hypothetical protein